MPCAAGVGDRLLRMYRIAVSRVRIFCSCHPAAIALLLVLPRAPATLPRATLTGPLAAGRARKPSHETGSDRCGRRDGNVMFWLTFRMFVAVIFGALEQDGSVAIPDLVIGDDIVNLTLRSTLKWRCWRSPFLCGFVHGGGLMDETLARQTAGDSVNSGAKRNPAYAGF